MTRVAYIDATAGIAGDMCLGALLDCGLRLDVLEGVARGLDLGDLRVQAERVMKGPIAATKVDVVFHGEPIVGAGDTHSHHDGHAHRTLADVLELLSRLGDLDQGPLAHARRAFELLAEAEGRVHGKAPADVHFHEVGAADALVDIAGTCIGLAALDVEQVFVSALPWSTGTVEAAHGTMALPAPATAYLMEGFPTTGTGEAFEQVTPTGAALVRALAETGASLPAFTPEAIGFGAGTHPGGRLPNVVRIAIGEAAEAAPAEDDVIELATNLDDATAQVTARALEQVMSAGALDAWIVPATMKKGRAGAVLHVLAEPADVARIESILFAETPTLGVRRHASRRTVLARRHESVETPWGAVRMKVRDTPGGPEATPEHDDCRDLADAHGVALRKVIEAAQRAWSGA
ncbi:MAG: nickel pincer cofactor biosynthesis protein LarC [Planctomycetota bacterium]|nr:nickel pincer cofactor biosynthesis protein LarC [Planctomycetota bacterium]